jgi:hypothetical protein
VHGCSFVLRLPKGTLARPRVLLRLRWLLRRSVCKWGLFKWGLFKWGLFKWGLCKWGLFKWGLFKWGLFKWGLFKWRLRIVVRRLRIMQYDDVGRNCSGR